MGERKKMGLFANLGKRIDRGIVGIGKAISALGRKITGVGERIEKKFAPEKKVTKGRTWRDKAIEVMEDEDIDPGMTDEEIREKYDNE
jgi:hypothetical protein